MQEMLGHLFGHLAGLWRFRWLGLGVAWLVAILGWLWVSQMPDQYLAAARVHVPRAAWVVACCSTSQHHLVYCISCAAVPPAPDCAAQPVQH